MYTEDAKPVELTLGRSRLSDVPWAPSSIYAAVGAHRIFYRECHYLANPGNYQSLVISWNDAGSGSYADSIEPIVAFGGEVDVKDTEAFLASEGAEALRHQVVMNSYGVTSPFVEVDLEAPVYGVDLNDVRVLDSPPGRRQVRRMVRMQSKRRGRRNRTAEHR
jgi:hypothetical protein